MGQSGCSLSGARADVGMTAELKHCIRHGPRRSAVSQGLGPKRVAARVLRGRGGVLHRPDQTPSECHFGAGSFQFCHCNYRMPAQEKLVAPGAMQTVPLSRRDGIPMRAGSEPLPNVMSYSVSKGSSA
jgi:hypothetical protein